MCVDGESNITVALRERERELFLLTTFLPFSVLNFLLLFKHCSCILFIVAENCFFLCILLVLRILFCAKSTFLKKI